VRSGRRLGLTATRFLRYLLPLCLVAATAVAGMGLWRVVGRTSTPSFSQAAVSLTLGAPGKTTADASAAATAANPVPKPSLVASPAPVASPKPVPVTSPVAILNASAIHGLAARLAALLREKGVVVASVDNLRSAHKPGQGTVFYPPGQEDQAQTLASLSGAPAVAPAPDWIAANGRLVLVVTDSSTTSASGPLAGS
jgi:hypothetical protein